MKTVLKIVGVLVLCLAVLLGVLWSTGLPPRETRPGLWIKGKVDTTPVTDWTWTNKVSHIELQTHTWYWLPHSVTIDCLAYKGQLYLSSAYPSTIRHVWNDYVMRNPNVLLKIGDHIYKRKVYLVKDPAVIAGVLAARRKKYPRLKALPGWTIYVFHVVG